MFKNENPDRIKTPIKDNLEKKNTTNLINLFDKEKAEEFEQQLLKVKRDKRKAAAEKKESKLK